MGRGCKIREEGWSCREGCREGGGAISGGLYAQR